MSQKGDGEWQSAGGGNRKGRDGGAGRPQGGSGSQQGGGGYQGGAGRPQSGSGSQQGGGGYQGGAGRPQGGSGSGGYQGGAGRPQGGSGNQQGGYQGGNRGHSGDFRGRGGEGRGGRGGYGASRGAPPSFVKTPVTFYTENDMPRIDKEYGGKGWLPFNATSKDEVKIQQYKGKPAEEKSRLIKITVNHFPLEKFTLPKEIFHYDVTMERVRREPGAGDAKGKPADSSQLKPLEPQQQQQVQQQKGKGKRGNTSQRKGPGKPCGDLPGPGPGPEPGGQIPPKKLPKPLPQLILHEVLQQLRSQMKFYGIVSDLSNNIYSTKKLEGNVSLNLVVNMSKVDKVILQEDDTGDIKVTITPTGQEIDTKAMAEYLKKNESWKGMNVDPTIKTTLEQVYNAVVKSMPNFRFLPLGRSNLVKWPDREGNPLDWGIEVWKGITANIHMGWLPYLNVDIAHNVFLQERSVVAAVEEKFQGSPIGNVAKWDRDDFEIVRKMLKNVKVHYTVKKNGQNYQSAGPVTDVLETSPRNTTFTFNNREISIENYFSQQYQTRLVNPDGLCLVLRRDCKVPAELCTIKKGQSYNKKLDDKQTSQMLTIAKKTPDVLKPEIESAVISMELQKNLILKEWGVNVGTDLLQLNNTRVLEAPKLRYGDGTKNNEGMGSAIITPEIGQWDIWSHNFKFFSQCSSIKCWGLLEAGDCRVDLSQIGKFVDMLRSNGEQKGVNLQGKPIITSNRTLRDGPRDRENNLKQLEQIFEKHFISNKCEIVVVIIPKKNSSIYAHVKQVAELKYGILTQCVVGQNVFKCQPATIQNILLKINSKLGGINHVIIPSPNSKVIDMLKCPMLIIGADVTHPPPGSMIKIKGQDVAIPSFCSVTGSIDKTCMPFMMDIRAQTKAGKGAAEVIQNLGDIVLAMLRKFAKMTKDIRPRKIIYFRDGVGEGQFSEVLYEEMREIRRACEQLTDYDGGKYEPKITFITVQKRHKTRFFYHPQPGRTENAPPGTVVDTKIIHQTEMDFYLMSQKGMMGTSRPTRYHVLWDDSLFTADQIQTLTYYLCYMYVRCTKSVKIPAVTYYAHWAAARAKALSDGMEIYYGNLADLNNRIKRHTQFADKFPMHFV